MSMNIQGVIQALSRAVEVSPIEEESTQFPVITLSRDFGAGGLEVSEILARRYGVEIYDEGILDAVAERMEVDKNILNSLHERESAHQDSWLYAMVTGKNVTRSDYVGALVTVMRGIYHKGGVIMGRGAHVVLEGREALRVRLTGSMDKCAKRIAHRERLSLTEARRRCETVNKDRATLVWNLFKSRLNEPANFDLTINTDHFEDFEQVADILIHTMEMLGLDERKPEQKSAQG